MYNMEQIRSSIEHLSLAIANTLKLEVAIFDCDSRLFFCTPTYLKKKGKLVHAPSIQEVIEQGSVLVNQPGKMPSCIGCRFRDHCPSTVDILCCIRVGAEVAGVANLTSFTKEGQRRIEENTSLYLNTITELGNIIGGYLQSVSNDKNTVSQDILLQNALEINESPLLLCDPHGVVLRYNRQAAKLLQGCSDVTTTLWQLFSEDAVKLLLRDAPVLDRPIQMGDQMVKVTSQPVMTGETLSAVLLCLSEGRPLHPQEDLTSGAILGDSAETEHLRHMVKKLAASPTPVLLTGETGTGKELVARAMHEQGPRRKYPFVAINCSSIPESLFESELFGYSEGSFTGAKRGGKIGKIELAQGGTLFLDELGEMPLQAQPKLLRVLQEYTLERVGSVETIHLDIRVIAATNRDLKELIRQGRFREDLYYRINVINLDLPPLRRRAGDILPIALNYLGRLRQRLDTPLVRISPEVQELLVRYDWPGNVRELQNVMEYAANMCDKEVLDLQGLPAYLTAFCPPPASAPVPAVPQAAEAAQIQELLARYGHTMEGKKLVAAQLGISLRTLYRKLNRLQLAEQDVPGELDDF